MVWFAHFLLNLFESKLNHLVCHCKLLLNSWEKVVYLLAYIVCWVYRILNLECRCNTWVESFLLIGHEFKFTINDHSVVEEAAVHKKEVSETLTKVDQDLCLMIDQRVFKIGTLSLNVLQKCQHQQHDSIARHRALKWRVQILQSKVLLESECDWF